jgi:hypothetical protein
MNTTSRRALLMGIAAAATPIAPALANALSAPAPDSRRLRQLAALVDRIMANERELNPLQALAQETIAAADAEVARRLGFDPDLDITDEQGALWCKTRRDVHEEMGVEAALERCKPGAKARTAIFDEMVAVPVQSIREVGVIVCGAVLSCQIPYLWDDVDRDREWAAIKKIIDNVTASAGVAFPVVPAQRGQA